MLSIKPNTYLTIVVPLASTEKKVFRVKSSSEENRGLDQPIDETEHSLLNPRYGVTE